MNFHEVRFPTGMSFGAVGGPERRTDIVRLMNGFEERNTPWEHSIRHYDAGAGLRSLDDLSKLIAFFEARRAQLYGFRWKDWSDYKSCLPSQEIGPLDQELGRGDGQTKVFRLCKTYVSGEQSYVRPIKKPVKGTVKVALSGDPKVETAEFTVNTETGEVAFELPPDIDVRITAGFEFDVPVRFDIDRITTSISTFNAGEVPSIPVIEVRI
jgi:uncharacterized protein (TIGR02217 family)